MALMQGVMLLPYLSEVSMAAAKGQGSCTLFRATLGTGDPTLVWHQAPSPRMAWKGGWVPLFVVLYETWGNLEDKVFLI